MEGGIARRRPIGFPAIVLIAMAADVIELVDHDRAVRMALVGDLTEMGDDLVAFGEEIAADQDARAVCGCRLDHYHGCATPCPLTVISEVAGPGHAFVAHIDGMSAKDDAVLERHMAKLEG